MIGSLLYLTVTRPDIQFSVCLCAHFQVSLRTSHWQAVKRIFRYLCHTPDFSLWYSASSSLALHGFSDADFAGCRLDRKSTSGTCQFLGSSLVSWSSRKQSSVAQSTTEAEYVVVASCCSQLLWITYTMSDFGEEYTHVPFQCDSNSAISVAKNPVLHSKTKHIEVRYHFQASPRTSHRQAVKRIFRYLRHTPDFGLWYSASSSLSLHGFSYADFVGCRLDRKSTSGTCQFLGSSLVSWSSRKQLSVAQSTTEAEYVATASYCSQLLWITYTMSDFGEEYTHVPLQCDSTSAISVAKNSVLHSKTKHIEVTYHFLRDNVEKGKITLIHVPTHDQLTDIFTKPLDQANFTRLRGELGVCLIS
jgi:hypothetical protein